MKRIGIALVIGFAIAGIAIAQSYGYGPMGGGYGRGPGYGYMYGGQQFSSQKKTIEGTLVWVDQVPAIKTSDATYVIRMPGFWRTAYIDGIKEGSTMKLEGYDLGNVAGRDNPFFFVTKATINGKTYDIGQLAPDGREGGFGGGFRPGCYGQGGYGGPGYGRGMMGGGW